MSKKITKPLYKYQLVDIIRVLVAYKKFLITAILLGIIVSVLTALLLPVYYKSTTIVYPVSMTIADRSVIFGQQQGQAEFSYFGNKYDASRILQVANSTEISDYIINKYDLAKHYKYNKDEKYLYTKVKEDFIDNYHAFKNEKDAIEITLFDTDKDLCATMVNDIVSKINEVATQPVTESKEKIIKMLEVELAKKRTDLAATNLSDYQSNNLKSEITQLSQTLTQYNVSANDNFSAITILEKAVPAEKKSKPIRWLLVLLGSISTVAFSIISVLSYTQYKYLKKKI